MPEEKKEDNTEEKTSDAKLSKDAEKIMEMVEKMTVLDLNDLVKALENKFGVSASAPMMVAGAVGNGAGATAEPEEEKTEFDVILAEGGTNKIAVIKAVRDFGETL